MKAQVSFEFMLYLAVAALALSTALFFSAKVFSRESALDRSSTIAQFVAIVNFNMQFLSSSFYAYIPSALCGVPISGGSLVYGNSTYLFYWNVSLSGSLCPGGGVEEISLARLGNNTYSMGVVG